MKAWPWKSDLHVVHVSLGFALSQSLYHLVDFVVDKTDRLLQAPHDDFMAPIATSPPGGPGSSPGSLGCLGGGKPGAACKASSASGLLDSSASGTAWQSASPARPRSTPGPSDFRLIYSRSAPAPEHREEAPHYASAHTLRDLANSTPPVQEHCKTAKINTAYTTADTRA